MLQKVSNPREILYVSVSHMKWVYRLPYFHKSLQNSTFQQRRLEVGIESIRQWSHSWWKVISKLMEWHFPWELVWILWACSKISYWLLVYESRFCFLFLCWYCYLSYFCFSFPSPRNSYEQMWWSVGIFWNFIFHISIRKLIPDSNCGAAGAGRRPGPEFRFPLKWWDSLTPSGRLEPDNQQVPKREQKDHEGKRKSPRTPKFEQKPAKVCTNKIALQTCNQST